MDGICTECDPGGGEPDHTAGSIKSPWGAERIRGELLKLAIRVSKRTVLKEYAGYVTEARPHQAPGQRIPSAAQYHDTPAAGVVALPVLGGLHHDYRRAA